MRQGVFLHLDINFAFYSFFVNVFRESSPLNLNIYSLIPGGGLQMILREPRSQDRICNVFLLLAVFFFFFHIRQAS